MKWRIAPRCVKKLCTMQIHPHLDDILQALKAHHCTIPDLLSSLLQSHLHSDHPTHQHLSQEIGNILSIFLQHSWYSQPVTLWVCHTSAKIYANKIRELSAKENGWHFSAVHASPTQVQDFRVQNLTNHIHTQAPEIWDLLGTMLTKNAPAWNRRGRFDRMTRGKAAQWINSMRRNATRHFIFPLDKYNNKIFFWGNAVGLRIWVAGTAGGVCLPMFCASRWWEVSGTTLKEPY